MAPTSAGLACGSWLEVMLGLLRAGSLEAPGVSSAHLVPVLHRKGTSPFRWGSLTACSEHTPVTESQGGLCLQEKLTNQHCRQTCSAKWDLCRPGSRAAPGLEAHSHTECAFDG